VQNAVQAAQTSLKQKNIEVRVEAPSNLPSVLGDAKLLTQVFLNIIVNAEQSISAGAKHGHIDISLAAVDDRVAVTVVDDGPGIAQENIGKIFDPFFTTKRPGGGSGLGLTIALAVLKEHSGTIDVESAPGSGAAFQVTMPAVPIAMQSNPQPPTARVDVASRETLAGRTALVVDDEESIREILQEGLASRGMKVDTASNAEDALAILLKKNYDVVLCDFNLPKLSGEAFFNELTKRNAGKVPHFVFITGELVDADRTAQINRKGASVLQKPFRVPAVASLLANLFQQTSKIS
jgi:CheY-like chemotaxis protein